MSNFSWLNEESKNYLLRGYTDNPERRVKEIIANFKSNLKAMNFPEVKIASLVKSFEENFALGNYSMSSPIWSNYGMNTNTLPVSCFGTYVGDSVESILEGQAEVGMMSKVGGGTSLSLSELRPAGAKIATGGASLGVPHFTRLYDSVTNIISQGNTRRGRVAVYLDAEHPDILEFLDIGTEGSDIQNITTGVEISEYFMDNIRTIPRFKATFLKILERRGQLGFPYIFFKDNVNNNKPTVYKDRTIKHSNLCVEIALPNSEDESFVCVLASLNVANYDKWRSDTIETLVVFLDTVVEESINKIDDYKMAFMGRAKNFLERHRALGLGVLGYHTYLQKKMWSFESKEAAMFNLDLFKRIKAESHAMSESLGERLGRPKVCLETDCLRRNTTVTAIAPTISSSFILGQVSAGIDPIWSNYYTNDLAKIKHTFKNPQLRAVLSKHNRDDDATWSQILKDNGSVQRLEFLSDDEKEVFKTYWEINQEAVIDQAAVRQTYIDQGQSLNLFVLPSMEVKDEVALIERAWKQGVGTIYYQHNINAAQDFVSKLDQQECKACEA